MVDQAKMGGRATYYPVYLDMKERNALVVGAGGVAERKVESLLSTGARVRVVAPDATEQILAWAQKGHIEFEQRPYEKGDTAWAFLVFCATDDEVVNASVFAEAEQQGVLVNVVDDPAHCSFIVPSIMRRGPLQVSVSTGGVAPAFAKHLRHELEETYPCDLAAYVELLGEVRELVKTRISDEGFCRARLMAAACNPSFLARLRAGEVLDAEALYAEIISTDESSTANKAGGSQ